MRKITKTIIGIVMGLSLAINAYAVTVFAPYQLGTGTATTGKVLTANGVNYPASWQTATGGGHIIQDEGTSLTQRAKLNFVGAGVTVTDGGGTSNDTIVTIPGGGGGMSIGDPVTSGVATNLLFINPTATLAQDTALQFVTDYVINNTSYLQVGNNGNVIKSRFSLWDGDGIEKFYIENGDLLGDPTVTLMAHYADKIKIGNLDTTSIEISTGGFIGLNGYAPTYPLTTGYKTANTTLTPAVFIDNPSGGNQTVFGLGINGVLKGYFRGDSSGNFIFASNTATGDIDLRTNGVGGETNIAHLSGTDLSSTFYGTIKIPVSTAMILGAGDGATPSATTIRGAVASGVSVAGTNITFDGSVGTGLGGGGDFIFRTAPVTNATAVAYANSAQSVYDIGNTLSITNPGGANSVLIVWIYSDSAPSSITYNTQTMTLYATNSPFRVYYLVNPLVASNTITVNGGVHSIQAIILDNVNQTAPIRGTAYNNGNGTSSSVAVSSATNDLVLSFNYLQQGHTAAAPGGSQTQRLGSGTTPSVASTQAGASTVTDTWSWTSTSNWYQFEVSVKQLDNTATNTLTEATRITKNQNLVIGGADDTARIHLPAGTATANTAPLKFTSGTLLTTPEAGATEFLTDDLYFTQTNSTIRKKIVGVVAVANLTGQTATKTATTIHTPGASRLFKVNIALQVTTAASTSSILGGTTGVVITYTEPDGSVAQSIVPLLTDQAGAVIVPATGNVGNTTTTQSQGSATIYAKAGVAIQYAIGYTSVGATSMAYSAHISIEAL
ncbi:MAG: hypothetical protein NT155_03765 [Candidatus Staskawiczbacteria bacterium]|nr:hypothetical protein [Candidatus Staskawiczbacteria bacterium]